MQKINQINLLVFFSLFSFHPVPVVFKFIVLKFNPAKYRRCGSLAFFRNFFKKRIRNFASILTKSTIFHFEHNYLKCSPIKDNKTTNCQGFQVQVYVKSQTRSGQVSSANGVPVNWYSSACVLDLPRTETRGRGQATLQPPITQSRPNVPNPIMR